MQRLKIGFDLDSTLNNLVVKVVDAYNAKYQQSLDYNLIDKWDFSHMLVPECKHIWQEFCDYGLIRSLDIEPTAVDTLTALSKQHDIYFVTAGHPYTLKARDDWLDEHFPFYRSKMLIVAREKQLLKIDVLIDDYEQNLIGGDYLGILMNQPWNSAFKAERYGIKRIGRIAEVQTILEGLNGR